MLRPCVLLPIAINLYHQGLTLIVVAGLGQLSQGLLEDTFDVDGLDSEFLVDVDPRGVDVLAEAGRHRQLRHRQRLIAHGRVAMGDVGGDERLVVDQAVLGHLNEVAGADASKDGEDEHEEQGDHAIHNDTP